MGQGDPGLSLALSPLLQPLRFATRAGVSRLTGLEALVAKVVEQARAYASEASAARLERLTLSPNQACWIWWGSHVNRRADASTIGTVIMVQLLRDHANKSLTNEGYQPVEDYAMAVPCSSVAASRRARWGRTV